ncbi:MAG: hypothetical protein MHM6MM_006884 [Cercozoa sp. M6MM]
MWPFSSPEEKISKEQQSPTVEVEEPHPRIVEVDELVESLDRMRLDLIRAVEDSKTRRYRGSVRVARQITMQQSAVSVEAAKVQAEFVRVLSDTSEFSPKSIQYLNASLGRFERIVRSLRNDFGVRYEVMHASLNLASEESPPVNSLVHALMRLRVQQNDATDRVGNATQIEEEVAALASLLREARELVESQQRDVQNLNENAHSIRERTLQAEHEVNAAAQLQAKAMVPRLMAAGALLGALVAAPVGVVALGLGMKATVALSGAASVAGSVAAKSVVSRRSRSRSRSEHSSNESPEDSDEAVELMQSHSLCRL